MINGLILIQQLSTPAPKAFYTTCLFHTSTFFLCTSFSCTVGFCILPKDTLGHGLEQSWIKSTTLQLPDEMIYLLTHSHPRLKKKKKYARKMPMEVKNEVRSMVTFYFYMLDSVYGINVVTTGFGKSRW